MEKIRTGAELIARERARQVEEKSWGFEHDDRHKKGELAMAACCYAAPIPIYKIEEKCSFPQELTLRDPWPFDHKDDKRFDRLNQCIPQGKLTIEKRIRFLAKAGALIAAEIDRLKRLEESSGNKYQND